jgi:hypothetical protein
MLKVAVILNIPDNPAHLIQFDGIVLIVAMEVVTVRHIIESGRIADRCGSLFQPPAPDRSTWYAGIIISGEDPRGSRHKAGQTFSVTVSASLSHFHARPDSHLSSSRQPE